MSHSHTVFVVRADDGLYVLKCASREQAVSLFPDELDFMMRLPMSPFVLRPVAAAVDASGLLRGYLLPYQPASSLSTIFSVHNPEQVELSQASHSQVTTVSQNRRSTFPWSLKLVWIVDVVCGLAFIHSQGKVWGDMKAENIVLCRDCHCRLIDYYPRGYTVEYAPPELIHDEMAFFDEQKHLTPERDIFSLGLVLWMIAEEVSSFNREVPYVTPKLTWSEEVPSWYIELVTSCIADSASRPTLIKILDTLDSHISNT